MKKMLMIVLSALVISVAIFLGYRQLNKAETYIEITYKELEEKIQSKDKFVLFIGKQDCSHCQKYKTTVNKVVEEYKVEIFHIDISKLTTEELAYITSHFPFTGTPTTLVIENGKEYKRQICRIDGAKSYEYTVNRLKKAGIIKE